MMPSGSFPGSIISAFFISFSLGFHSIGDTCSHTFIIAVTLS